MCRLRVAGLIWALFFVVTSIYCGRAFASPGCTALNGEDISPTSTGSGSGTGFNAGDVITLTVVSDSGPTTLLDFGLEIGPPTQYGAGATDVIPSFTTVGSRTYTVPATTSEELSLFIDANLPGGTSGFIVTWSCTPASSTTPSGTPTDSTLLRSLQVSTTPMIAQISGQAISGAVNEAIGAGFSGNPAPFMPNGSGFTAYFDLDPKMQPNAADQDSLQRFLASPAGGGDSGNRVDDGFSALGYAGLPAKAPPLAAPSAPLRDWLAWVDVRGTDFDRTTSGSDLNGDQINAIAGLTHRLSRDVLVGVLGGYENFSYSSIAYNGTLKGDGWTSGAYLGWYFAPHLRFDAAGAWSYIGANDAAGSASGNFTGNRWLTSSGITGTYAWQAFVLEPSARVYALWEHENAYTDSLGTLQASRDFSTGRGSGGMKVSYPFAWTSTIDLAPYVGLYGDYYFSWDNALATGLTTVPLLQGWSARVTGGLQATFRGGAQLTAGGEYAGIGDNMRIWTWQVRGSVPF